MSERLRLPRRLAALVASALLAGTALVAVPAAAATPGPATFRVQGSVEQFAITHATPGATIDLHDASGAVVDSGTVDALGSLLFRDVSAGDGYVAVQDDGGNLTESSPTHVMSPTETPPQSFYDSQTLNPGFGYITTRDGTKLSVTVHLPGPVDQGPYPTVIEYSGYDPSNPNAPQPSTLVSQLLGYATVGVNIRGTGCSGGSFFYFEQLQSLDGYDVVETVAAQPWVLHHEPGMVGISYPGISQLFVAQTRPPHLAAIAPLSVIADTYRSTLYPGGIFNNGFALSWAQERVDAGKPYGEGWEQGIVDAGGPNGAQCAENQLLRLQNPDLIQLIDEHPFYDDVEGDPLAPITFVNKIDVPVFLAGAWQDEQTGGQFPVMLDKFTSAPFTRFTMTNGMHVESWMTNLQRWSEFLDFFVAKRIPHAPAAFRALAPSIVQGVDGVAEPLPPDRFDSYTSYSAALAAYRAEPPVRVLFENGWGDQAHPGAEVPAWEHDFSQWPPRETVPTAWYFQPDQQLSRAKPSIPDGDGKASTSYTYDPTALPQKTLPSGDAWSTNPPYQWKPIPLGTGLAFDSAPLTHDTVMVGSGSVDLWLRSSAPDTDVEVQLTEIRPDGQERFVQAGWLRASHRKLDPAKSTVLQPWHTQLESDAAPLPAGQFTKLRIALFPFAYAFRAGSRIRLTIDAPGNSRPIWTFDDLAGTSTDEVAHSIGHPSRVVLPVIPGIQVPASMPPCPSLRGEPCRPYYGLAAPADVQAHAHHHDVAVTWSTPGTVRPGDTISGYTVTESPGGAVAHAAADANDVTFSSLGDGTHFFTVRADYEAGGNSGPSTPSDNVTLRPPDTTPPQTHIGHGPSPITRSGRATFRFSANEPSTFACSVDLHPFAPCASPDTVHVGAGFHLFLVRATDRAGNVDPTPAARVWYVDDAPPACHGFFGFLRPDCRSSAVRLTVARWVVPVLQHALDARSRAG